MADYTNKAQQRIIKVIFALAGHEIQGLTPTQITDAVSSSNSITTRDLANLQEAGVAEQITETGRWRLTPRVPQIAMAMLSGIDRAQTKVNEVQQRYTRER